MNDDAQRELREVQAFFRLPSIGLVEKDLFVVRAIAALTSIDAAPFRLVFGGGTALARAHKLVRRMSEDVDFKIVLDAPALLGRSLLRQRLGALRDEVTAALQAAEFAFDPQPGKAVRSRNESRYTIWQLPYDSQTGAGEGLRPTIQVELTYAPLRTNSILLPVRSFVAEAYGRTPEVPEVACVSVTETAAEKLISLTRRTAMELAGLSRDADATLIRHIYDLHVMRDHVDPEEVASLARVIAAADANEFGNQYPAYKADIAGETHKALNALRGNPIHRLRYDRFIDAMVYGERLAFDAALGTVEELTNKMIGQGG